MPGKTRKQKERKSFKSVAVSEQPASIVTPALKATFNEPSPVKSPPTPATASAKAAAVASPYIKRELLTIALMTGIALVVIIVLSIVLR